MRTRRKQMWAVVFLGILVLPGIVYAQQPQTPPSKKDEAPAPQNRITIEVTGGTDNKPIENASVYVKTVEQHLLKDKKFEVDVKTGQDGVVHVPDAPLGKVEIQVVAEGWKPFGRWYEITDPKQVIKIHLERPPKWY